MRNICRRSHQTTVPALAVALVWAGVTGCGGPDFPKTYPLSGKVVYKGGKPVQAEYIEFETVTDPPWRAASPLNPNGEFVSVTTHKPDGKTTEGIVAGEHRVRLGMGRGGDPGEQRGKRTPIPARYLDYEKSGLKIQVPAPDNRVVIELEEGKR